MCARPVNETLGRAFRTKVVERQVPVHPRPGMGTPRAGRSVLHWPGAELPTPSEGTKGKLARAWGGGEGRHREPPLGEGQGYGRMPNGAGSVALSERVDDTPPRPSPVAQTSPRRVSDIVWHSVEFPQPPPTTAAHPSPTPLAHPPNTHTLRLGAGCLHFVPSRLAPVRPSLDTLAYCADRLGLTLGEEHLGPWLDELRPVHELKRHSGTNARPQHLLVHVGDADALAYVARVEDGLVVDLWGRVGAGVRGMDG